MPALVRAELTLRLTQALDDQLFHTTDRASEAATSQDYQVMLALALGHAIWVHDRYVEQLSDDDIDEYYTADDARWEEYSAGVIAEVPASYRAIRVVAQRLGPMFIEALSEEGRELVEHAFTNDLPAALDQVSLPAGKYLRRDRLEAVTAPPGPLAAEVELSNQMGPFGLYLLLSTGQPATDALTAADGWGNDRYTAYVLDGRVCVDVHVVADSRDDADRLENGFNAWARAAAGGRRAGGPARHRPLRHRLRPGRRRRPAGAHRGSHRPLPGPSAGDRVAQRLLRQSRTRGVRCCHPVHVVPVRR
ncbi:MAG: hypothetical protein IPL07_13035 [Acidimicrobiaceae bacterium]|nr:hypothetical protein [Acidimicrobiaceae bacterium]